MRIRRRLQIDGALIGGIRGEPRVLIGLNIVAAARRSADRRSRSRPASNSGEGNAFSHDTPLMRTKPRCRAGRGP